MSSLQRMDRETLQKIFGRSFSEEGTYPSWVGETINGEKVWAIARLPKDSCYNSTNRHLRLGQEAYYDAKNQDW